MKKAIPSLLSGLRLLLLPLIWQLWIREHSVLAIALYVLATVTDWADGRLARRLGTCSKLGAFLDVVSDVLFLVILLGLLGVRGIVPGWLFVAPLASAIAFLLTSERSHVRYDPIGKYFGTILYALVGILLAFSTPPLVDVLWMLILGLSMLVTANRLTYWVRDRRSDSV